MAGHITPTYRNAEILSLEEKPKGYINLVLGEGTIARTARPGQFVMIRAWPAGDPVLPRPFDIVSADPETGTFRLCVKVEGRGTALLASRAAGDRVSVTGPLGRGIETVEGRGIALLVRGAGAAAVVFLAREAALRGIPVYTVLSAASANRLVCRKELEETSKELLIATDDGTEGYKGSGTDLLDRLVANGKVDQVYTCGARRFARHVRGLDESKKIEGFVFLEGFMACGMGDCHGCAVKKADGEGYYLVCRDGPVFPAGKVVLE
jgi:dihydroorotate dehydrogenase electron transfer subunit